MENGRYMLKLAVGVSLLQGRYELTAGPRDGGAGSQVWEAYSEGNTYLLKSWGYVGDQPDRVQRALWDHELRTLYKVASSPKADDALAVLKDAGLDREHHCFVMVLEAEGYDRMTEALHDRARHRWLANRDAANRSRLWDGIGRIATGLRLLHERQVLHRGVDVDSLYFDDALGPESFRLGGFEWSVKLGRPVGSQPPAGWPEPPERFAGRVNAWSQDDDWFAFGMLCARIFLNLEAYAANPPRERYDRVLKDIEKSVRELTEAERKLLLDLVAEDPLERLTSPYDIIGRIQEIAQDLSRPPRTQPDDVQYIVSLDLKGHRLLDELLANGLRDYMDLGPTGTFIPADPLHRSRACEFVRQDLQNALLYAVPGVDHFILVGGRLSLRVTAYRGRDRNESWQIADCRTGQLLRFSEGDESCQPLPAGRVFVYAREDIARDRTIAQDATSWEPILPRIDRSAQHSRELAQFHDFVRISNQIELLLLDSQIFPYEVVRGPWQHDSEEYLVIRERNRPEGHEAFDRFAQDLIEFLHRETKESGGRSSFILSDEQEGGRLRLPARSRDAGRDENLWQATHIDSMSREVTLSRNAMNQDRIKAPVQGFIRSAGMPGQISLFQRRKKAIDALDQHSYLLRSLASPAFVRMDTGVSELPIKLDEDRVDAPKRASIEDILRVRPIYTLQGPPGTGKTTLVAWLLREILAEDPVVQVLVTAQAHGAVDVLRAKVGETFSGVPESERPLEIRLGANRDSDTPGTEGAEAVAKKVLQRSIEQLEQLQAQSALTATQSAWLEDAKSMVSEIDMMMDSGENNRRSSDFVELVKRGASVTYCTTSARDLVALAADQAFDWSIVEEAGKAHGFDLALPLQAGHRWLLIGDQKQLNPYRYEDYREGIENLDRVVQTLKGLKTRASGMLDEDWLYTWDQRTPKEQEDFRTFAKEWLKTFAQLFDYCELAAGAHPMVTGSEPKGASAGRLIGQHRMHPHIGTLISDAYYGGQLDNRTVDEHGQPLDRVRHAYSEPEGIADQAVVWLDVPWCKVDPRTRERGTESGEPRYGNPAEAHALARFLERLAPGDGRGRKLAVLAPYSNQVSRLASTMRGVRLPDGLEPQQRSGPRRSGGNLFPTHTVDSFQGNQADVVAVSLVRNNEEPAGQGLGFLDYPGRINVLLSRAEQLLILVGSWDFFVHQVQAVELADTSQPLWHLAKIVTQLGTWFDSGMAVRIDADMEDFS
jgi:hypothetical protein